jgi:hypothetical protein
MGEIDENTTHQFLSGECTRLATTTPMLPQKSTAALHPSRERLHHRATKGSTAIVSQNA